MSPLIYTADYSTAGLEKLVTHTPQQQEHDQCKMEGNVIMSDAPWNSRAARHLFLIPLGFLRPDTSFRAFEL